MTLPPAVPAALLVLLLPLIAWRVYKRVRKLIGRQRLSRVRPWITVCLIPLLVALLALAAMARVDAEAALAAGVIAGVALGVWGLRLTGFEHTAEGLFYTPNAHIGIALSLLLVGRLLYRLAQLYVIGGAPGQPPNDFARSPVTLAIIGTLAGYYVTYAIGLLRWRAKAGRDAPQVVSGQADP